MKCKACDKETYRYSEICPWCECGYGRDGRRLPFDVLLETARIKGTIRVVEYPT